MNQCKKHKIKRISITFFSISLSFIGCFFFFIYETKNKLHENIYPLLIEAVNINIAKKSKEIYYAGKYKYDPTKMKLGEYETRTAQYEDTTFTYRRQIFDPATDAFMAFQTCFLDIGQLHSKEIHHIYDSLLKGKNIHLESIIGITSSFYTTTNDWSSDTTVININSRAAFINQGDYEDINYYAYIHYSFYTLWKLMPKVAIYILFFCSLFTGLLLIWRIIQKQRERRNYIIRLKNGNYQIVNILFETSEKRLISNDKELKLTPQLYDLLLLFLSSTNYRVSKAEIKNRFWPSTINSVSNMTSTVNRLNKGLKNILCVYAISIDSKNDEYYILSRV